jgi:cysteine desulfurase
MTIYLDCNATTPIEPEVRDAVLHYMEVEFGNAGSRTHEYGARANRAVLQARDLVAQVVAAERDEVVFTSGATEANNLALLGLAAEGERTGHRHIISSPLEHKAVLEPLEELGRRGFEIELLPADERGWIDPEALQAALRTDTLLVSLMHVNNETGVRQPLEAYASVLEGHDAFFHVDAAQGFGKELLALRNTRIDLISISGHKIYGPKGVGALIARRRGYAPAPLRPLMYGGGQERGLRPGTLPVPLVVGLGKAAELAQRDHDNRREACRRQRRTLLSALAPLEPEINGDQEACMPHCISLSFQGLNSEALMVLLKDQAAISNGSACTSQEYRESYVLKAMGLPREPVDGTVRISWCHRTPTVDWAATVDTIGRLCEPRRPQELA